MKRTSLFSLVLATTLVLSGCGLFGSKQTPTQTTPTASTVQTTPKETPADTTSTAATTESASTSTEAKTEEKASMSYSIAEGSQSGNVAQKKFLGKPTQVVVGSTSEVSGIIIVNSETHTAAVSASIMPNFSTDSGSRDGVVKGLFNGNITVEGSGIAVTDTLLSGSVENLNIPLQITINGTTKTIPFAVTVNVNSGVVTASGSGSLVASEFGITTPSAVGVYTVDDAIGLKFSLTAK